MPGVSWVIKEGAEGRVPAEARRQAGQEGDIADITEAPRSGLICCLNVETRAWLYQAPTRPACPGWIYPNRRFQVTFQGRGRTDAPEGTFTAGALSAAAVIYTPGVWVLTG